ncbi:MAG TPA: PLP-dependent aminotransferase family protein [Sphingomicrobium sp.]|nr:PLP-dependent aminotransferase family protein [Sphingomicrobium sp.]
MTSRKIGAASLQRLMAGWRTDPGRAPAYRQIEQALRLLVLDGRLPIGIRLPGERNLAPELGVSRTTVAAAYAELREQGFLASRHGSGSVTRLPGGATRDAPIEADEPEIDFSIAALSAPKEVHAAYADALVELPRHLPGIGYEPAGLPDLRAAIAHHYARRGLPTAPEEVLVTQGAQHGLVLLLNLLARPGDRIVVDHPTYSKALEAILNASCQPVPVQLPATGWDLDQLDAAIGQTGARLAYLLPDFHNPTGRLMDAEGRRQAAAIAMRRGCHLIVDETMVDLWLDRPPPPPLALFDRAEAVVSLGSMGKSFWGGLRIGWIRASRNLIATLSAARAAVDMGSPIVEQLAASILLHDPAPQLEARRRAIGEQRDHLLGLVRERLPDWQFQQPVGGLSAWAELPRPVSTALAAETHRLGVRIAPGNRFGVDGAFERFVRLPYALPAADLSEVVDRLTLAWGNVASGHRGRRSKKPQDELTLAI